MDSTYIDDKVKNTCNGCGVCALVCPKKCIQMQEDKEGFLYPVIDESKCIKCGKCKKYCANYNGKKEKNEKAYVAINKSSEQLKDCSSGGMFYILAQYVIENKGVVFGVTYNSKLEVVHDYAESLEDCKKFCGSKYVRSNLQNSYEEVHKFLEKDRYVLFTGTACQVNGLKVYLGKKYDKLILCDVLCHANPSPKVFELYIKNIEKLKGKNVKDVLFRSKENGWKNQTPIIEYEDGEREEENTFFHSFVSEMINRPSCYACKFASKRRISDFTIGDFWGIEKVYVDIPTENGVSLLNVNSKKALEIFEQIKGKMQVREVDYDLACSFNHYDNVKEHKNRNKFFTEISNGKINETNIIKYMKKYTKNPIYVKCLRKFKKIVKGLIESKG